MTEAAINQQVVQAIVDTVLLAVKKELAGYDKNVAAKMSNIKISADNLLPGSVTSAALGNGTINAGKLNGLDNAVQDSLGRATFTVGQITDLNATVARLADAQIKNADIDFAQINGVSAGTVITAEMIGKKVLIKNLMVTEAMIGSLTAGELIVRGTDGGMYALIVDKDGNVTTQKKYVENDDVKDLDIDAGKKLVKGSILADNIGAGQIMTDHLTAASVTAEKLAANCIEAGHINAGAITTDKISSEVGEELDISSNEAIRLRVTKTEMDAVKESLTGMISVEADRITNLVSDVQQKADNSAIEGVSTRIDQVASGVTTTVTRVAELENTTGALGDSVRTIETSFAVAEDGVTLKKSDSDFDVNLSNEQLSFRDKGNVVSYISNKKFFIRNGEVTENLTIGRYQFQRMEDGSLGLLV